MMNNDEWQCGGQRNKCSHSVCLRTLLPPSLSPVLHGFTLSDLITYCCSSPWPIKPYHWPAACQFYASALLIKGTHDTATIMLLL